MSDVTITRAAFLADPAAAILKAERLQRPIVVLGEDGQPSAIISAPRDARKWKAT
jgi:hypothetical protein